MQSKATDYYFVGTEVSIITVRIIRIVAIILFLICGPGHSAMAQDLLKLKSGKEIRANILEEGTDIIKYREYDNPSGPVYSVRRDQVESIKYKKGNRGTQADLGKPVSNEPVIKADTGRFLTVKKRYVLLNGEMQSPRNVKAMMEDYPGASATYESGRKMCNASNSCALGIMVVSLTSSIISNGKSDDNEKMQITAVGLGIDGGLIIAGIILASKGKKNIRRSVDIYNSSLRKPVSYKLDFGIQDNGIGFGIRF
jgi:hypothetical protein